MNYVVLGCKNLTIANERATACGYLLSDGDNVYLTGTDKECFSMLITLKIYNTAEYVSYFVDKESNNTLQNIVTVYNRYVLKRNTVLITSLYHTRRVSLLLGKLGYDWRVLSFKNGTQESTLKEFIKYIYDYISFSYRVKMYS